MVSAHTLAKNTQGATQVVAEMHRKGIPVSQSVYNNVLSMWARKGDFHQAVETFRDMRRRNVAPSGAAVTALIDSAIRTRQLENLQSVVGLYTNECSLHPVALKRSQYSGAIVNYSTPSAEIIRQRKVVDDMWCVKLPPLLSLVQDSSAQQAATATDATDAASATGSSGGSNVAESERLRSLQDRQLALETRALDQAVAEYSQLLACVTLLGRGAEFRPAQVVLLAWFNPLTERITKELAIANPTRQIKAGAPPPANQTMSPEAAAELQRLPADKLSVITIHEALSLILCNPAGVRFSTAAMNIGRAVSAEMQYSELKKRKLGVAARLEHPSLSATQQSFRRELPELKEWSSELQAEVGGLLLGLLLDTATITIRPLKFYGRNDTLEGNRDFMRRESELLNVSIGTKLSTSQPLVLDDSKSSSSTRSTTSTAVTPSSSSSPSSTPPVSKDSSILALLDDLIAAHEDGPRLSLVEAQEGTVRSEYFESVEPQPAFMHTYRMEGEHHAGFLECHKHVLEMISHGHMVREVLQARLLPMVIRPRPWLSPSVGGYLRAEVALMRTRGPLQRELLEKSHEAKRLTRLYSVLDKLGAVPWRVNERIYSVVRAAWDAGGGLGEIPTRSELPYPPPPQDFGGSPDERRRWRRERLKIKQKNAELHSLRCSLLLKLEVAREFLHDEAVYFPHNLDFRGRCYPVPPHLNHMGSDLSRGLLQFAEAKPLGPNGLRMLKVHLANLCGHNKINFDERVAFTDAHMEQVLESAAHPLDGSRWWAEQENPWQALAACNEIAAALASGDPERFESRLPVHVDGSCNGLQHYAALGGDVDGARSVNLLPLERPQDVYSGVLELVNQAVNADAAAGMPLALKLAGKLTRKTIKQTVMTSVYGVTFVGARAQIASQLKDVTFLEDEELFAASSYLAHKTFESMQQMFTGAKNIMKWLSECARIIGAAGQPMSWTTPIGLPIVQPYRQPGKRQIKTLLQWVVISDSNDTLPINVRKQSSAFPPNYVHSLDSTHMFYTAERCNNAGITFAAVHDSYWTHACHIPQLNDALRHAFVELHKSGLLEMLRQEIVNNHPDLAEAIPPLPQRGPLEIESVLQSKYFFH